tara:strand:+ start:183 stop:1295 length:1113 start_codon:yes stop_codon:yes gene_type:complete
MVNKKQSIAEARKLLSQFAPKGESLAFINEDEARLLKAHGGSGELTEAGIPTYFIKSIKKIGKKLKKVVKKVVPKELGQIAQIAAMIPGPHQPFAVAASALGGYREGGLKGALKSGLGAYAGGKFTSGLAQGAGATGYFGQGLGNLPGTGMFSGINQGIGSLGSRLGNIPGIGDAGRFIGKGGDYLQNMGSGLGESVTNIFGQNVRPQGGITSIKDSGMVKQSLPTGKKNILGSAFDMFKQDFKQNPFKYLQAGAEGILGYLGAKEQNESAENQSVYGEGTGGYNLQYVQDGGRIGLAYGGRSDPAMEMDYREGGFIPVGAEERADDVPARLSKNEFVMTADAVRAAGGGSVDVGAQRMYDLMNNLEAQA